MAERWRHWPAGTRVRLKVRTIGGWRGTATMLEWGNALRDGSSDRFCGEVTAAPYEWARMRDQTANPEHVEAVARAIAETPSVEASGERRGVPPRSSGQPSAIPPSDPPSEG